MQVVSGPPCDGTYLTEPHRAPRAAVRVHVRRIAVVLLVLSAVCIICQTVYEVKSSQVRRHRHECASYRVGPDRTYTGLWFGVITVALTAPTLHKNIGLNHVMFCACLTAVNAAFGVIIGGATSSMDARRHEFRGDPYGTENIMMLLNLTDPEAAQAKKDECLWRCCKWAVQVQAVVTVCCFVAFVLAITNAALSGKATPGCCKTAVHQPSMVVVFSNGSTTTASQRPHTAVVFGPAASGHHQHLSAQFLQQQQLQWNQQQQDLVEGPPPYNPVWANEYYARYF